MEMEKKFIGEIKILVDFEKEIDWSEKVVTLFFKKNGDFIKFEGTNTTKNEDSYINININEIVDQLDLGLINTKNKEEDWEILTNEGVSNFLIYSDGELDWK